MSTGQRALVNLGAGFDSAWQGVKQITPGLQGPTDAELHEKRERDQPRWPRPPKPASAPIGCRAPASALQFAGEAAPTLAIPGVGVGGQPRCQRR